MIDIKFIKEDGNLPFKCEVINCKNKATFSLRTDFAYNNLKAKVCNEHLEEFVKNLNDKYEEIKIITEEEKTILSKKEELCEK